MERFMGMMPSSEIELEKRFDTGYGLTATIQAGPNGWTVIYADSSTTFRNIKADTKDNFNTAFEILKQQFNSVHEWREVKAIPTEQSEVRCCRT